MGDLIAQAKQSYSNIRDELREVAEIIREKDERFSTDILLKQFSLMMQAIMLRQIAADGVVKREERLFIREICDRYDLLAICRKQDTFTFKSIDWDQLENFNFKTMKVLCHEIDEVVHPLEDELTFYLALIDASTPKNYYQIFFNEVGIILNSLNYIDDDLDENEKEETVASFLDHFITRYRFFYNSLKKGR